jgi:proteasome activator subunit 4
VEPGCRPDNAWLQYNSATLPSNALEWDEPRYIHKSYVGFYAWPCELEVYAPTSEQPSFEEAGLTDQEREIVAFFGDQQNVDKFVGYLSLEGKKGRDKFRNVHMLVFKGLFRNHGDTFLDRFLPHLQKFVLEKQECSQRCATEIICGLVKGSKHWPYDMTTRMWTVLLPIIRTALSNLTVESIDDWTLCITNASKDRDPNRLHWLLECLMEESPLGQSEASFVECGRLTILQGALFIQSWRVGELLRRLLLRFENRLEESPFQNVRDQLASTLVSMFHTNVRFGSGPEDTRRSPEVRGFLDKIFPRLQSLVEDDESSRMLASRLAATMINSDALEPSEEASR